MLLVYQIYFSILIKHQIFHHLQIDYVLLYIQIHQMLRTRLYLLFLLVFLNVLRKCSLPKPRVSLSVKRLKPLLYYQPDLGVVLLKYIQVKYYSRRYHIHLIQSQESYPIVLHYLLSYSIHQGQGLPVLLK